MSDKYCTGGIFVGFGLALFVTGNPILPPQRPFDLLVRLVLTQRIHRPDGRGHPADQRDLQNQANNPRNRAANSEKYQKWQKNS